MVRYVLEDGGDVYLSDLDGAFAPARVREANCLESGFMVGGKAEAALGQIGKSRPRSTSTHEREGQAVNQVARKAIVSVYGYETEPFWGVRSFNRGYESRSCVHTRPSSIFTSNFGANIGSQAPSFDVTERGEQNGWLRGCC